MQIHSKKTWRALSTALILAMMALSIAAQQTDSLTVAGQSGSAKVIRVAGRNYVDVEGLARLTNSAMSFNGNQIILTMHGTSADAPPPSAPASGFSKEFVTTGIEAMAQMREWHATLKNAIERGYPLAEDWLAGNRAQAQQALRLASLSASTPADKSVLPFLTNEFNNMRSLCDKYLQLTASRTYIAPNSLDNDPLDQKIRSCAHSLAAMATSNQFVDDGSCQWSFQRTAAADLEILIINLELNFFRDRENPSLVEFFAILSERLSYENSARSYSLNRYLPQPIFSATSTVTA